MLGRLLVYLYLVGAVLAFVLEEHRQVSIGF